MIGYNTSNKRKSITESKSVDRKCDKCDVVVKHRIEKDGRVCCTSCDKLELKCQYINKKSLDKLR